MNRPLLLLVAGITMFVGGTAGKIFGGGPLVDQPDQPEIEHIVVQPEEDLWAVAKRLCPQDWAVAWFGLLRANPWLTAGRPLIDGAVLHWEPDRCPSEPTEPTYIVQGSE